MGVLCLERFYDDQDDYNDEQHCRNFVEVSCSTYDCGRFDRPGIASGNAASTGHGRQEAGHAQESLACIQAEAM